MATYILNTTYISSNFFKVFEYLLLPYIKELPLSSAQFGYRGGASTVLANALLKETIASNISGGGSVYSCFLDMSRACEYVNHELLLQKLVDKGMPDYIVKILKTIYSHTNVKVHVNGSFSDCWNTCKRVQGGITSAFLFNIYIDEMLRKISHDKPGCFLGINKINVQAYADDIVLISSSVSSLQKLMHSLMNEHELFINVNKTVVMIFNNKVS